MELIFIGTSSGKTDLNRFHSSLLFKSGSKNILIDAGDSISRALLNQDIAINKITDIIFSHYHSDHLAGLPSLITQMIISKRTESLNFYTHQKLVGPILQFLEISYIFIDKLDFKIQIIPFSFDENVRIEKEFEFKARQNEHIRNKYNIIGKNLEFISSSFLFKIIGKKVIYTSDIGSTSDLHLFEKKNADLFITETTHLNYTDIQPILNDINPKRVILTHIENETSLLEWIETLSDFEKTKIILADDGMTLNI